MKKETFKFLLSFLLILLPVCLQGFKIHKIPQKKLIKQQAEDQFVNATMLRTQYLFQLRLLDRSIKLLNVPDVMQATEYTCGPSSLSAVLNYYHLIYREAQLAKLAKTDQDYGTSPRNLLATIKSFNISAEIKQGMRISELQAHINAGRPIIVLIQAWADEGTSYIEDYQDGHYVVVIGYDNAYFYFEDPWILGSIGYIRKNELLDRWHDYVHQEARRIYNLGIIVNLPIKSTPVAIKLE